MIDLLWCSLATFFPKPMSAVKKVPRVLVFIPDGNRRWAKRLGKLGSYGHDAGLKRCREVVREAFQYGVAHVVFWGTSYSNLTNRPKIEVEHLLWLLKMELRRVIEEADKNQYRFRLIGSWQETGWADQELESLKEEAERVTEKWVARSFTLLFGYDFRRDMVKTISRLQASSPTFRSLTQVEAEAVVSQNLSTGFFGDVDFIIRTGNDADPHWSASFLGWNVANAQLAFLKTPWPAFDARGLGKALENYSARERRGGA